MSLRDRIPVEPLDGARLDRIEQRVVAEARPLLARPRRAPWGSWLLAGTAALAAARRRAAARARLQQYAQSVSAAEHAAEPGLHPRAAGPPAWSIGDSPAADQLRCGHLRSERAEG